MTTKAQQQKKAQRSKRCKSLLMLSPPFSSPTNSVKSSFLSFLRKLSSINTADANNNSNSQATNTTQQDQLTQLQRSVIPEPIRNLLNELYHRGPSTVGIFRKSPNAKHCRDLRQKLETDSLGSLEQFQVTVIASVFKEWLRSLPDCLLMSRLYPQWIDVAKLIEPLHQQQQQRQHHLSHLQSQSLDDSFKDNTISSNASLRPTRSPLTDNGQLLDRAYSCSTMMLDISINSSENNLNEFGSIDSECSPASSNRLATRTISDGCTMSTFALNERHSECLRIVRQLLDALNEPNLILLRSFICVLRHIADNSEHNKMSANNLGVCVGQSLLNDKHQSDGKATASTFTKRHRRTRSQCFLSSTLSLTGSSTTISNSVLPQNGCYLSSNSAQETAKYVPILVAFMIENAPALFGEDITHVFSPTTTNTYNGHERSRSESENDFTKASDMIPMDLMLTGKENEPPNSFVDQVDCGIVSSFSASSSANSTSSEDSLIKRVGSPKQHIVIEGKFHLDRNSDCNISNNDRIENDGSTTTSILIVNHSPPKRLQSTPQLQHCERQIATDTNQHRPLSVTESTSSSSRASSSTSGVHSESPAFSSEVDSHNARTTTSSPSSVSSPSSSASSPVQEETPSQNAPHCPANDAAESGVQTQCSSDHLDNARHFLENPTRPSLIEPKARSTYRNHHMINRYTTFMGVLNRVPKIPVQYTTSCYGGEAVIYNPRPRPRSMGRFDVYPARIDNEQSIDVLEGDHKISVELSSANQTIKQQAQHYNTISSSDEQKHMKGQRLQDFLAHAHSNHLASLVPTPSLPYLPHSSQNPDCHLSFRSPPQQGTNFRACQHGPANINHLQEHPIFYSTTNLNSLQQQDRYMLYHRASLAPQRSHVLSLRDYYLSLQAQQLRHQNSYIHHRPYDAQQHSQLISQRQQQYQIAVSKSHQSSQQHPHHFQNHRQQDREQHSVVQQPPLVNSQFQNGAMVTPAQSKIGMTNHQIIQRSQPRMAKIRQNQLNSVYVKQNPIGSGLNVGNGLVEKLVACRSKASSNDAYKLPSSENSSDESDEYMNDWMESTMV